METSLLYYLNQRHLAAFAVAHNGTYQTCVSGNLKLRSDVYSDLSASIFAEVSASIIWSHNHSSIYSIGFGCGTHSVAILLDFSLIMEPVRFARSEAFYVCSRGLSAVL